MQRHISPSSLIYISWDEAKEDSVIDCLSSFSDTLDISHYRQSDRDSRYRGVHHPFCPPSIFRRWSIENSVLSDWLLFSVFCSLPPAPVFILSVRWRLLPLSDDTNEISRNKKKKKKKKAKRKENFNGKRATEILARKVMPVAMATGVSC